MKGKEVRLNIGQKVGVRIGQRFKVVNNKGTLEVSSVEPDTSLGTITKGEGMVLIGLR